MPGGHRGGRGPRGRHRDTLVDCNVLTFGVAGSAEPLRSPRPPVSVHARSGRRGSRPGPPLSSGEQARSGTKDPGVVGQSSKVEEPDRHTPDEGPKSPDPSRTAKKDQRMRLHSTAEGEGDTRLPFLETQVGCPDRLETPGVSPPKTPPCRVWGPGGELQRRVGGGSPGRVSEPSTLGPVG